MWLNPLSELTYESGITDIDLYYNSTNNLINHLGAFSKVLSEEELDRANKFHFEKDRQTYIASHGALRILLAKKLNILPEEIIYSKNTFEKPLIEVQNCFFNLSHSSNFFCVAFSNKYPIGVDVEQFERNIHWQAIASKFFSDAENEVINNSEEKDQSRYFLAIWTRKEAILKAIGCGMVNDLQKINSVNDQFEITSELIESIEFDPIYKNYYLKTFVLESHLASIAFSENYKINSFEFKL